MNDKFTSLHELRIPDDARGDHSGPLRLKRPLVAGVALGTLGIALVGYLLVTGAGSNAVALPVHSVVVEAGAGSVAAGGAQLEASGYVVARRMATVSAKITGRIAATSVEEGQRVAAGQVLATLDDSNTMAALALAKAQASAAHVAYVDALPIFRRAQRIVAQGLGSQADFDNAKAQVDALRAAMTASDRALAVAARNQDDTVVHAPFAGIVVDKTANEGEIVSPNSAGSGFTRTGICTIVDMNSLEVDVDVNESFISRVRAGGPAVVKLDAYPDWDIPAEVIAVVPTADRTKGTVRVRVGFKTHDARILPEMSARVQFRSPQTQFAAGDRDMLYLPADAVAVAGDRGTVFVIAGDHVEKRTVRVVATTARGIAVASGVSVGEHLAAGDLSKLADGQKVAIQ